ncbi:MAG: hypothetical protein M8349_08940 [ANME-2 cluster archaeon]|nr:hypothetical protein [ANME-2 cluster archaeon]MDF1557969.1 hypothetical protein [ANME-2 cluster archaeon]
MELQITPRKFNILSTVLIYLSLVGVVISLYMNWMVLVWIFLTLGLVFFIARNASYLLDKIGKMNYDK